MADPQDEFRALLKPAYWSHAREDRVFAALERRRRRGTLSTVALSSALVAVSLALAIMWVSKGRADTQASSLASARDITSQEAGLAQGPLANTKEATTPQQAFASQLPLSSESPKTAIRLEDGSKVLVLGESKVRLVSQSANEISMELEEGRAWFDIKDSPTRKVEVRIADVRVHVVGTEFVVEEKAGEVFVWVQQGSAQVTSKGVMVQLGPDQRGRFVAKDEADLRKSKEIAPQRESGKAQKAAPTLLEEATVPQLWAMADKARAEARLDEAIAALDILVQKHHDDSRASLAAFTLGRVLLATEASPRRAAEAFRKARSLAPHAPLAEDALAREIEALQSAGAADQARGRQALYERLYPQGRHTERLRKDR